MEVLAQEGAAVVQRAPVPRRRVRSLDVGDDARTAVGAGERLRVLGACVEIKSLRRVRAAQFDSPRHQQSKFSP